MTEVADHCGDLGLHTVHCEALQSETSKKGTYGGLMAAFAIDAPVASLEGYSGTPLAAPDPDAY